MSTKHDNEKKKLIKEIVIYCRMLKKHAEKHKINLKNIWIVEG
jgi:hypothetical protein